MRQTRLPIDWIVDAEQSSSDNSVEEEQPKRGRPAQALQWTRVKTLSLMKSQRLMVYNGTEDLQFDKYQKKQRAEQRHGNGQFVFDPQELAKQGTSFSTAAH